MVLSASRTHWPCRVIWFTSQLLSCAISIYVWTYSTNSRMSWTGCTYGSCPTSEFYCNDEMAVSSVKMTEWAERTLILSVNGWWLEKFSEVCLCVCVHMCVPVLMPLSAERGQNGGCQQQTWHLEGHLSVLCCQVKQLFDRRLLYLIHIFYSP